METMYFMKTTDICYIKTVFWFGRGEPNLVRDQKFLGNFSSGTTIGRENAGNLEKTKRSRGFTLYENRNSPGISILVQGE